MPDRYTTSFSDLPHWKYRACTDFLLSLARVHPTWTPLAQELLFEAIWIQKSDDGMGYKAKQLLEGWKMTERKFRTKTLRLEGNLGILLGVRKDEEIWSKVEVLDHVNEESIEFLDIYSRFSSLKVLSIHARFQHSNPLTEAKISLPNLERFELHYPETYKDFAHDWKYPPPNRARPTGLQRFDLPSLKHLSLDVRDEDSVEWIRENLGEWLLRIEILDIRASLWGDAFIVTILNHPELFGDKLKHLSVWYKARNCPGDMEFFSWETKGFDLETFHLNVESSLYNDGIDDYIDELFKLLDRLGEIARGEFDGFKAKRVIYEGQGWDDHMLLAWIEERDALLYEFEERESELDRDRLEWPDRYGIEGVSGRWEDRFAHLSIA
ncbi:uncharacterized protein JCM6883_002395 [Sporobolomyces salmoneus]|uniref:uncharacterized protein n=1 Tax=Sporobolomyces salmoneus TaxID=183962 RepID=UPI00317F8E50